MWPYGDTDSKYIWVCECNYLGPSVFFFFAFFFFAFFFFAFLF